MAVLVQVTIEPERLSLPPGGMADVEVTIQNATGVVEHFSVSLVGLPEQIYECEPEVVKLRPKDVGTVRMRISLPERNGPVAGEYTLGVLVRSPYQQQVSRCEELPLEVQPAPELSMDVQPTMITGGRSADYHVGVSNEGNMPLAVRMSAADQENAVGFVFDPPELALDPGMSGRARVAARAKRPLTGQEQRRSMSVTATAGELREERPVVFVQRPLISGSVMRVGGIVAAITALVGATVGSALLIRSALGSEDDNGDPTANQTPTQVATGDPSPTPTTPQTTSVPPEEPRTADFAAIAPDGQLPGNRVIAGNMYQDTVGITLTGVVDGAPQDCLDATAVALRTNQDFGSFLTSSRPDGSAENAFALCNNRPVRVDLAAPARSISVRFLGEGDSYTLTVQLSNGTQEQRSGNSQAGTLSQVAFEVPDGVTIQHAVFGRTNLDPNVEGAFTIIRSITVS